MLIISFDGLKLPNSQAFGQGREVFKIKKLNEEKGNGHNCFELFSGRMPRGSFSRLNYSG